MALASLDDYFPDWKEREALAEAMIPIIGRLYRRNVVSYCYGRALYNQSVIQIMKTHRYVRQLADNELSEFESYPIIEALSQLDLGPSHIDVGKLASKFMEESEGGSGITPLEFCERECAEVIGRHVPPMEKAAGCGALRIRPYRPSARPSHDRKNGQRSSAPPSGHRGQGRQG